MRIPELRKDANCPDGWVEVRATFYRDLLAAGRLLTKINDQALACLPYSLATRLIEWIQDTE